jgi:hypothetical protein
MILLEYSISFKSTWYLQKLTVGGPLDFFFATNGSSSELELTSSSSLTSVIYKQTFTCIFNIFEPGHDKTNIMGLRPAWIQTRLRICAVWSGSMLFAYQLYYNLCRETNSEKHGPWSDCADAQTGLDPCWSQTHHVGFIVTRLIWLMLLCLKLLDTIKIFSRDLSIGG